MAIEELPVPEPKAGEVRIELQAVGICGSDVHYWQHGRIGDFVVGERLTLGHEAAGRVVAVGEGVSDLAVGDRVALEPGVACLGCAYCAAGRYNLCPDMKFWATPPYDGCLSTYATLRASNCFKLPDNVTYEEGAMLEPFSVGVYACRRAGIGVGARVLIVGAGTIGCMCLLAARAFGAMTVTVVDPDAERLAVAQRCGADDVVHVASSGPCDLTRHLPTRPEVAFECSGSESGLSMALDATASGGKVVAVGCLPPRVSLPLVQASMREVDILGVFRYCDTWPKGIEFVSSGKVDFAPLLTHRFDFRRPGDVERAFECALHRRDAAGGAVVKAMIRMTDDEEHRQGTEPTAREAAITADADPMPGAASQAVAG